MLLKSGWSGEELFGHRPYSTGEMTYSRTDLARWAALGAVFAFLGVLLWLLPQPGYRLSRFLLFGALAAAALVGGLGVLARRPGVTAVGIGGLVLLGFWQAVLGIFVLPVIVLLLVVALLDREEG